MIATRTSVLLSNLRKGTLDPEDTDLLEQTPANLIVNEFRPSFPITIQERRIGRKWELSIARSLRAELKLDPKPDGIIATFLLVPAYIDCLMLSIDDDLLTGISRQTRLAAWAIRRPEGGLAIRSGRGFKLDRTPDGWSIKPLRRRIVKLSAEFLRSRGWRFDHLMQFIPVL